MDVLDTIIVGGGPAGLSAALVLGRCRRRVLLFDHGRYRNRASRALHGFLSRDGIAPGEFRRLSYAQLAPYPSVAVRCEEVIDARRTAGGFEVVDAEKQVFAARTLLLATGLVDQTPEIAGLEPLLGVLAHHCPYCDGWEHRDEPLLAYAHGNQGACFALELTLWSARVTLCTDGGPAPDEAHRARLQRKGIGLTRERILRVQAEGSTLHAHLAGGSRLSAGALFYSLGCQQASPLARMLGVATDRREGIEASRSEESSIENLFVAGDASRDALQAVVAAGEGSKAALAINKALMRADLG